MTTGHQLFVQLCEELLPEASTSLSLIGNHPGSTELIRGLHRGKGLSHKQEYRDVPKISWNDLKSNYSGTWVLIKGAQGTGAIRWTGRTYEASASTGGDPEFFSDDKGGNIIEFLKKNIGKLNSFYVGKDAGDVRRTREKRLGQQGDKDQPAVSNETLLTKFKPLWEKAIIAAQADIKGVIVNMIKNDAYQKAQHKIERLSSLDDGLTAIQSGSGDVPGFLRGAVSLGVLMAAAHYYPEETGEIQRSRYGGADYSSTRTEGPRKLLADISGGDTKKMGTVLAFFKRALVSR